MKPKMIIEFSAKAAGVEFKEESVTLHDPEELLAFVAPGGGCETIPDEVDEVRFIFLPPQQRNVQNPIADVEATLELGMAFFTGPLSEIAQTIELLIDKAGRGELSPSFLAISGLPRALDLA